ncbi:MAG: DNA-primase RepB domain-containing protein [Candidatus Acidiferrales bacterium]
MSADLKGQEAFVDAPTYIKDNFEPSDRIAILVLNRQTRESRQRITTAEKASSPEFQAWLRHRSARGDEIYVGMNALKPDAWARTKDQVAAIRHLYVDLDHGGERAIETMRNSGLVPEPNYVLNTSPEKYQIVWKVDGIAQEQAEALQRAMVREFGGDPAATDSTRVLRLPTFPNRKHDPPHMVMARADATQTYHQEDFKLRTDAHAINYDKQASEERERGRPQVEITQSERDWAFAKRALARGDDPEEVIRRITDYRGDEKHANYARYTVEKAQATLQHARQPFADAEPDLSQSPGETR